MNKAEVFGLMCLFLLGVTVGAYMRVNNSEEDKQNSEIVLDSIKPDYFYKLEPTTQSILECITTCERK